MKFQVGQAVAALGSLWLGQQQGKQYRQDEDQGDQQRALSLLPQLAQMEQAQREQELEPLRFAASLPGQTPESQQAMVQALLTRTQAQAAQPRQYGPDQYLQQARLAYPHAHLPQVRASAPQAGGVATPSIPTPQFQTPGTEQATSEVVSQLRAVSQNAAANGDEEGAGKARDLLVQLARKQITPEQALSGLASVQQQGKITAGQDRNLEEPFQRLRKSYDELRVKDPLRPQVGAILNRYGQLPVAGAERRAALLSLAKDLGGVGDYADLSPDDKQRLQNAKAIGEGRVTEQERKFVNDLTRVKGSPKDVLAVADAYHRWAQTPDAVQYGAHVPAELNPTPQMITEAGPDGQPVSRQETAEEVDARRMGGAAKFLEDPKDKAALQKTRIALLGRLLTSGRIQGSLDPILSQLEDALNGGAEPTKLTGLKFDSMTAQQREQIHEFNARQAQGDRNFGLQEGRLKLDQNRQQLENDKFSYEKDHGKYAKKGAVGEDLSKKDAKLLSEAQKARTTALQIIASVDGKLIKEPDDEKRAADAKAQVQAAQATINRLVGPLDNAGSKKELAGPPNPGSKGADTPQGRRARYVATLRAGNPKNGIPGVDPQTAERMANQKQWR